jgi:prepilin-type N-terminal cleavage/methylation domain-containing protein
MGEGDKCVTHVAGMQKSFTLIELIVCIAVLAVVSLVTIRYLADSGRLYAMLLNQAAADEESATVIDKMRRETRPLTLVTAADSNRVEFAVREGPTNSFQQAGADIRFNGAVLATDAARFALAYYDATNGPLSPAPLDPAARARVRRIEVNLSIRKDDRSSDCLINIFCPNPGIVK